MQLLRWFRRRASLAEENVDDIIIAEFSRRDGEADLTVSVYETDDDGLSVTRTHAEHAAGNLDSPPKFYQSVNVVGLDGPTVQSTRGTTSFAFTTDAHRELLFSGKDLLRNFVRILSADRGARTRVSDRIGIRDFILGRLEATDLEWKSLCANKTKWSKFVESQPSNSQTADALSSGSSPSATITDSRIDGGIGNGASDLPLPPEPRPDLADSNGEVAETG